MGCWLGSIGNLSNILSLDKKDVVYSVTDEYKISTVSQKTFGSHRSWFMLFTRHIVYT